MISVQTDDFDPGVEYRALIQEDTESGAVVLFVGRVRAQNQSRQVQGLELEHYPGMTESSLQVIADEACQRWKILRWRIIHRVGRLSLGDQIVLVGVSSAHREDAFAAANFMMDFLKTRAPFWKKESTAQGEHWVEAQDKDQQALDRWEIDG
jgi:molybdopterin synthase catalytic subunit